MNPLSFYSHWAALLAAAVFSGSAMAGVAVPNDDFGDATVISGVSGTTSGDNTTATQEVDEPEFLTTRGIGSSIWWRWTAPESGRFTFDTIGTGTDTILGIYTGTALADLEVVVEIDEGVSGSNESKARFDATAGTEYFIAVDAFDAESIGPVTLNWASTPAPTLAGPTMVYGLRSVYTWQGMEYDDEDNIIYLPKETYVSTGFVVRGRTLDAFVTSDQAEAGPVAVVYFYSYKEGNTTQKRYTIAVGTPDPDDEYPSLGFISTLVRMSKAATGVYETGSAQAIRAGNNTWFNGLMGRATLTKVTATQTTPMWFAKKLTGTFQFYSPDFELEFTAQGQPIPGYSTKNVDTLTFSPTETTAVNGQDFDAALATVIARLAAKGYLPEDDTIDILE